MTEREKIEREIILDILAESSKWRVTEDDQDVDCIRMEVMDRAKRLLLGADTVDEHGYAQTHQVQSAPEPEIDISAVQAIEASRLNEHLEQKKKQKQYTEAKKSWNRSRVRVFIDGKPVWRPLEQCIQVPRDNSRGGLPWTWKWLGATITAEEKKVQEEKMWAEHEQSK